MTPSLLSAEADRCVKCGLCLPACPTYRERQDEGDSPRGRVALVQALAEGLLEDARPLQGHIDRCLGCRACETVCPSGVRVTALVDGARALHRQRLPGPARWPRRWLLRGLSTPRLHRPVLALLRWLQRRGTLEWVARRLPSTGRLGRLYQLLPRLPAPRRWRARYLPAGPASQELTLFLGCVARSTEPEVAAAALRVLNRLGLAVHIPPRQVCCGAMYQHNGEVAAARRMASRNLLAFSAQPAQPILTTASGCADHLRAYSGLDGIAEPGQAAQFAGRVTDISRFLCHSAWPEELALEPLPLKVAVHDPCSLRNGLGQAEGPYELLRKIPGIRLYALGGNSLCCGAAGTYLLQQAEMSAVLGARKIEALRRDPPDLLVTSNPGCALQLAAGIRAAGLDIEVLHPVQLLDRQMRPSP